MKSIQSIWNHFSKTHDYPSLKENITTEVAIIGGGITGITAGKTLSEAGISSVVLESHTVGSGTTSHSTGNLYYTVDGHLSPLKSKYNTKKVKAVAASRAEALQQMRRWIEDLALDCDYKKVPWYLYSSDQRNKSIVSKELKTGNQAKLSIKEADRNDIPFPMTEAATIAGQAQINPMSYVQELAATLKSGVCQIFEDTRVASIDRKDEEYHLQTSGGTVTAKNVIHATHTPKGIKFVQTLLGPYREYGVACKVNGTSHPEGIYWGLYEQGTVISSRLYHKEEETFLIVVGKPHKVGHKKDNDEVISSLEDFARRHFNVQETVFRWGGQHYRPADLLPYIGPVRKGSNEFVATGFSTDGLVYGTLSAMIIADEISGQKNKWADLYDAARMQPVRSGPKFLKENLDVASQYIKDLAGPKESMLEELEPGEGQVVKKAGKRLAVYRNEEGELEALSAVCTHMGCNVHWNSAEKTWDCPCHGSRFSTDGTVIEGPALDPLQKNPV